jgi:hypothetical protein
MRAEDRGNPIQNRQGGASKMSRSVTASTRSPDRGAIRPRQVSVAGAFCWSIFTETDELGRRFLSDRSWPLVRIDEGGSVF